MNDKVRAAIAVFDKSAERTRPNAQTEAWTTLRAHIEGLEAGILRRDDGCIVVPQNLWDEMDQIGLAWKARAESAEARVRELKLAGKRVVSAFSAHGKAAGVVDNHRTRQECEAAMLALDAAMRGEAGHD